jgi:hypothetical protein
VTVNSHVGPEDAAYRAGRRDGLALGALALALVAFVNLLSVEKSILAVVLALLALKGAPQSRRARWALAVAGLHIVIWIVAMIVFHDKLAQLLKLLQHLG